VIDKKSYLQKWANQLRQWDAEIDELKSKAEEAKAESRMTLINQIDELRVKQESAQNKLEQLRETGDKTWNDMLSGLETSWKEFRDAFSKASAHFK
jgi:uncharacterized coiled-coil DUF342 family protein